MALDKFSNTGLSTLASGIDASQTTATLATSTGSRFPADTFNVVVWNSTDFANPIDDSDREIVRCTSRAGDVLTIVRGQEGTTGVTHNTAGKTYSVALIVSQKFRDDIEARLPNNKPAILADTLIEPATVAIFYEDFETASSSTNPGAGAVVRSKFNWQMRGNTPFVAGIFSAWRVLSDGTNGGVAFLSHNGAATLTPLTNASKKPKIRVRWSQAGTVAGTRRIGCTTSDIGAIGEPDGIYFRHIVNGNIIAVARNGGVESTIDTLVVAADGVFHTGLLDVVSTTKLDVYIDGVLKDTITTNIPTADLGPGAGLNINTNGAELRVDYIYVSQDR